MNCAVCGKVGAKVLARQDLGRESHDLSLCEECARQRGIFPDAPGAISFRSDLFGKLFDEVRGENEPEEVCRACGTPVREVERLRRLGCVECLDHFRSQILRMMDSPYDELTHRGRYPAHVRRLSEVLRDRVALEQELDAAVEREDYERAAELRRSLDEIAPDEKRG